MDAITTGVISDLVAQGLVSAVRRLSRRTSSREAKILALREWRSSLPDIVAQAASSVSVNLTPPADIDRDRLVRFIKGPEPVSIVGQLFALRISATPESTVEEIKQEFVSSAGLHLGVSQANDAYFGRIFQAIIEATNKALAAYVELDSLPAHDARTMFQLNLALSELAAVKRNIALLTSPQRADIPAILRFESDYRDQVKVRFAFIIPPHIQAAQKIPIDNLFVAPNVARGARRRRERSEIFAVTDFLNAVFRSVLLGNPGGGKSTLAQKLAHGLASSTMSIDGASLTPLFVTLREYAAARKERNSSIVQYMEDSARTDCQIDPPSGAIEYLLLNGRAIVIFDGLDELLDTSHRQQITTDVEVFCNLYASTPVLVTSRVVGYEQAPIDPKMFDVYGLTDFDNHQVSEYANKWFATHSELSGPQQKRKAESFVRESSIVEDLRANPLMLALMCNIFLGENYIPRNRPDIYEKCANLLFEKWDKSRGIVLTLPFQQDIDPAMKFLAFWIYSDESLQGGVARSALVSKATDYLYPKRFDDRDEAERAAEEFIAFCTGRAWVFTDTGTTEGGEGLYQFTHRTFLEFFTAAHLVRTHATARELWDVLRTRVARREWDVVAQLAFQLMNKRLEGAGDQLLDLLLQAVKEDNGDRGWNHLSFASRSLEFMVPSPKTARQIGTTVVKWLANWAGSEPRSTRRRVALNRLETVNGLLNAGPESRKSVSAAVIDSLEQLIEGAPEKQRSAAIEVALAILNPSRLILRNSHEDLDGGLDEAIMNLLVARRLHYSVPGVGLEALRRREIKLKDFVVTFGAPALFSSYSSNIFWAHWPSPAASLVAQAIFSDHSDTIRKDLEYVGEVLQQTPMPWVAEQSARNVYNEYWRARPIEKPPVDWTPDAMFGLFCLLAVGLEGRRSSERRSMILSLEQQTSPMVVSIQRIVSARYMKEERSAAALEAGAVGFNHRQRALADLWITRKASLVRH